MGLSSTCQHVSHDAYWPTRDTNHVAALETPAAEKTSPVLFSRGEKGVIGVVGGRSESESSAVRGTNVNELTVEFEVGIVDDLDDETEDGAYDDNGPLGACSIRACHSDLRDELRTA